MLLAPEQFLAFLAAAMLITASPGPDNLMVLGIGVSRGRRQGMVFGLGCALGCISHTVLAALGVSALIAASPAAFALLKTCGGLYLIWLGMQAIRSDGGSIPGAAATGGKTGNKNDNKTDGADGETALRKLFLRGLLANSINPKVVLFFLSFLPQFVVAGRGHASWQTAQLGLLFTAQAALLFGLLGYFSGAVGQWMQRHPRAGLWLDRIAGGIFIALGARLIFSR
jgi:threonine/homoserine/homoserine lactone efflux protein